MVALSQPIAINTYRLADRQSPKRPLSRKLAVLQFDGPQRRFAQRTTSDDQRTTADFHHNGTKATMEQTDPQISQIAQILEPPRRKVHQACDERRSRRICVSRFVQPLRPTTHSSSSNPGWIIPLGNTSTKTIRYAARTGYAPARMSTMLSFLWVPVPIIDMMNSFQFIRHRRFH